MIPRYRIWCKKKNEWEKDFCVINSDGDVLHQNKTGGFNIANKDHIVVFSTGLKDCKGVEIFSGDIVKNGEDVMLVGWSDKFASFCLEKEGWAFRHFFGEAVEADKVEVIGNIHQNPELLQAATE